jgi:hypothetical protein
LQVMNIEPLTHLRCHNSAPCQDVHGIHVTARRTSYELELGFFLEGNISRICLTSRNGRQGLDELWRHTCFEAFIALEGQAAYHEFNFAPSREWRVYGFRAYRDREPLAGVSAWPAIAVNVTDERLELCARIFLNELSTIHSRSVLRLGLSAVIESQKGLFSYWALHHPGDKPDFHHPGAFALRLEPPESGVDVPASGLKTLG